MIPDSAPVRMSYRFFGSSRLRWIEVRWLLMILEDRLWYISILDNRWWAMMVAYYQTTLIDHHWFWLMMTDHHRWSSIAIDDDWMFFLPVRTFINMKIPVTHCRQYIFNNQNVTYCRHSLPSSSRAAWNFVRHECCLPLRLTPYV